MIYQYNDNELLYLMYENVDEALGILFDKYSNLIWKRIGTFKIALKNRDDFFQEGLMALNTALVSYNPFYNKTFNKYFDLILQRRFMYVLGISRDYFYNVTLVEDINSHISEDPAPYKRDLIFDLNDIEKDLYNLRYVKRYKCNQIAKILNWNIKKVYNSLYALREKIKNQI